MLYIRKVFNIPNRYFKIFLSLSIFIFFLILCTFSFINPVDKSYSLFVEFDNAYGIKEGTQVTYKGVNIGSVSRISLNVNKVVVLLNIKSSNILIPYNTLFEANQIGLFNDIVISITPQYYLVSEDIYDFNLDKSDNKLFNVIPHNSYIKGYKGISYDDLIRSTTRISQRFDDPRFFSLVYLLLKNSIYISDEILILIYNSSFMCQVFTQFITLTLSKYFF